jgi:hypothetical protein
VCIKLSANGMLDIAKDKHSWSDFKRNTGELLDQMRGSGYPLVLTINAKPEILCKMRCWGLLGRVRFTTGL